MVRTSENTDVEGKPLFLCLEDQEIMKLKKNLCFNIYNIGETLKQ